VVRVSDPIVAFLEAVGLTVRSEQIAEPTFLPGIAVRQGVLTFDPERLLYPGDLLHEAGHLAVMPADERAAANGPAGDDPGLEMAAIAWSWAAAREIGIAPSVVFHPAGYKGGSDSILENFTTGNYFGVPLLELFGLTGKGEFPSMRRWLR
jgi:hypothetical protein